MVDKNDFKIKGTITGRVPPTPPRPFVPSNSIIQGIVAGAINLREKFGNRFEDNGQCKYCDQFACGCVCKLDY